MSPWTDTLLNAHSIAGLYDGPPPLDNFSLRELRLERRGPDCFVRGVLSRFPDHPRPNWPDDANRLQIRLSLSAVEDFQASGRRAGDTLELTIERADDGFGVEISGRGDDFQFRVRGIGLQLIGIKPFSND